MVWVWVVFGLVILFLLFLVVYLLDHWQSLDSKQRASFICNIITILGVVVIGWSMFKTNQELVRQQQESETIIVLTPLDEKYIILPEIIQNSASLD